MKIIAVVTSWNRNPEKVPAVIIPTKTDSHLHGDDENCLSRVFMKPSGTKKQLIF
jgi:hypothetical protein